MAADTAADPPKQTPLPYRPYCHIYFRKRKRHTSHVKAWAHHMGVSPKTPTTNSIAKMARIRSQAPSATGPSRTRSGKPFKAPALEQPVEPKSRLPSRRRRRGQQSPADDAAPATETCCWSDLPAAIWGEIVARLDLSSFLALRLVSKQLRAAVSDARPQTSIRAKCGVQDLRGLNSAFPAATRARVETTGLHAGIGRRGGGGPQPHAHRSALALSMLICCWHELILLSVCLHVWPPPPCKSSRMHLHPAGALASVVAGLQPRQHLASLTLVNAEWKTSVECIASLTQVAVWLCVCVCDCVCACVCVHMFVHVCVCVSYGCACLFPCTGIPSSLFQTYARAKVV